MKTKRITAKLSNFANLNIHDLISKNDILSKKRYKHVKLTNALWTPEEQKTSLIKYDRHDKCFKWWCKCKEDREPVNIGMLTMTGFYVVSVLV
jgi:hypothetical protein